MRKIVFIVLIILISVSCSVGRRIKSEGLSKEFSGSIEADDLLRSNLTTADFFISKATIEVKSGAIGMVFSGTIKYKNPGEYLISIRTGSIEAGRVYINSDTLLINNRINRTVYYGEPQSISQKFGVSPELLPLLFGDFVQGLFTERNILCTEGKSQVLTSIKGLKIKYIVDCSLPKVYKVIQEGSTDNVINEITYDDFFINADKFVPGSVKLENYERNVKIDIKIERLENAWKGDIEFIPGNNYELRELK